MWEWFADGGKKRRVFLSQSTIKRERLREKKDVHPRLRKIMMRVVKSRLETQLVNDYLAKTDLSLIYIRAQEPDCCFPFYFLFRQIVSKLLKTWRKLWLSFASSLFWLSPKAFMTRAWRQMCIRIHGNSWELEMRLCPCLLLRMMRQWQSQVRHNYYTKLRFFLLIIFVVLTFRSQFRVWTHHYCDHFIRHCTIDLLVLLLPIEW